MINWKLIYLDTFIGEMPKTLNNNFQAVQNYLDIFYDSSSGIIISPISTTGNISGAKANFVTGVFDNLIIKNQFTNLYENTTTIDSDYYNTYIDASGATEYIKRDASLFENGDFSYIDLNSPYYRMTNDVSLAFAGITLGQEFQLIWDVSTLDTGDTSPFVILIDPSKGDGTVEILTVTKTNASTTWIKLIAVNYDASNGMTYTVKQYGGTYTISSY